jgi:outer membrane protein
MRPPVLKIGSLLFGLSLAGATAQTTPPPPPNQPIIKPPPVPTGVIPLPQGSPPTGQQAPVPAPAAPLPKADRPLRVSPNLAAVNHYVESRAITLQDAVAIALTTNREFATAVAALLRAQARTGEARTALNPTVGVNANLTEFDAATVAHFGTQSITIVPQFNPVVTAAISLPLDITNVLRTAVSQAQFQEVAARIDVNRTRNQVVYDVKSAFYTVLRAQGQMVVATDSLNNALDRLNNANKNYTAGISPRFDVISAQRDVADAQQALINARAQVSISLAALKNTIGLGIGTQLRITDTNAVEYPPGVQPPTVPPVSPSGAVAPPAGSAPGTPPPANPTNPTSPTHPASPPPNDGSAEIHVSGIQYAPLPTPPTGQVEDPFTFGPEYDALLQEALKTRPEILETQAQIAAAQRGVQYARRSTLPSLSVSLGYTYTPNATPGFARSNQGSATLGVNIPIFDAGLARERVQEARADVATAEINRRQATDQVQVDVQQAYITLVQARNRVAVANVELAQARESYRLARVRYNTGVSQQTGVSPIVELSNAQTSLTQAQINQINALYDYNNARAQLDRAVGRYSFTAAGPGYPAPPPPATTGQTR